MSAALAACAGDQYPQTTFRPVTEYGAALNRVFANTFWWTMIVMVLVLALLLYVTLRFRERPGQPRPKQIHGSTKLELLWTTLPAIIVIFIAVPTVETIFETQRRAAEDALRIEVIGHQWWWEFRYPEHGVVTANQFYVPTGREVHLRLTSADVIHSFWVPRIGGKRDVNPPPRRPEGEAPEANHILFTANEPGTYSGQCAEFCGEAHAIMAMSAVVVTPEEFDAWVEVMRPPQQQPAQDTTAAAAGDPQQELVAEGARVFASSTCIACHAIAGTTAQGQLGPNLTRFGARPTIGAGALPNTQESLERWIHNPRDVKPGVYMPGTQTPAPAPGAAPDAPPFPPTGLTDEQVRAVAAYLSSLK